MKQLDKSLPRERLREIVQLSVITHLDPAHHFGQRLAQRGRGGIVLVSAVAAGGLPYMATTARPRPTPSTWARHSMPSWPRQG